MFVIKDNLLYVENDKLYLGKMYLRQDVVFSLS